ncbi:MAG: azurin [Methylobacillus glycogenes]|nr:azurin [Methylobacillus glycogenes]
MRSLILLALAFAPVIASAASCETTVTSGDTMTYSTRSISVPASCAEFTVNFEHKGHMPKTGMGHNWVLAKSADVGDVAKEGAHAGADNNFVTPGDKRVIAFTPIIGGGEKTSVKFKVSALSKDEAYTYFCSYPGHFSMMRGTLKLEE